jgi:hypothetical protein
MLKLGEAGSRRKIAQSQTETRGVSNVECSQFSRAANTPRSALAGKSRRCILRSMFPRHALTTFALPANELIFPAQFGAFFQRRTDPQCDAWRGGRSKAGDLE